MKKLLLLIPVLFLFACSDETQFGVVQIEGEIPPLLDGKQITDEFDVAAGLPAPSATFTNPDKTMTSIDSTTGTPKMVFFVAHWCPFCQQELEDLMKVLQTEDFSAIETHIVITNTDSTKPNFPADEWIKNLGIAELDNVFIHYDDVSNLASIKYGSDRKIPYTLIIDKDGLVLFRAIGSAGIEGLTLNYSILIQLP